MKTRRITRQQLVPHTIDGTTRLVPDDVHTDIPLPPRDWDRLGLNVVTGIVALALLGCVGFSTASIGDLLHRVTPAAAAYGAAILFDLVWIGCTIIEWLGRYTPDRVRKAKVGGYLSLAVAMGAVAAHGWIVGNAATGIVGAVVSGLAKGLWAVVLDFQAAPLSKRDAAFFEQELSEAAVKLARVPVRRRVNRALALAEAERIALDADRGSADPDRPDESADDPDADVIGIRPGAVTTKDAVRIAWDSDIRDDDAVIRYVAKVTGSMPSPDTISRYLRLLKKTAG